MVRTKESGLIDIPNLFKSSTMKEVLDELDLIVYFEMLGKWLEVGEVTNRQRELYAKLGVEPPTSLQ